MKSASSCCWRLRFRFGLRTLFVVVTLVCAAAAWFQSQRRWIRERHEIIATYRVSPGPFKDAYWAFGLRIVYGDRPEVPWHLRLFGEKGWYEVELSEEMTDSDLRYIESLFPEAKVTRMWLKESFARRPEEQSAKIREQFRAGIEF